jgi:hypothetical protein
MDCKYAIPSIITAFSEQTYENLGLVAILNLAAILDLFFGIKIFYFFF